MILPGLEDELTQVVERLRASVVRLDTAPERARRGGSGSGVVVDPAGVVVTNAHVVDGHRRVSVTLPNESVAEGAVLGADPSTDLAVVRCEAGGLLAATFADSQRLRVGQFAVAIGNALGLDGGPTVSLGVVSAVARPMPGSDFIFEGLVQTDAAINPGNSGGPLAALTGEVIGINTAMLPFAQGVGFAVPSNTVRSVAAQIRAHGRVVRPWLGVTLQPSLEGPRTGRLPQPRRKGVRVASVVPDGPAGAAGVREGDLLVRVGSTGVRTLRDLLVGLSDQPIGSSVELGLRRGALEVRTTVRLEEMPAAAALAR
jgi:serine protease Do